MMTELEGQFEQIENLLRANPDIQARLVSKISKFWNKLYLRAAIVPTTQFCSVVENIPLDKSLETFAKLSDKVEVFVLSKPDIEYELHKIKL